MNGNTIDMPMLAQKLRNWKFSTSTPIVPAISLTLLRYVPPEKKSGTNNSSSTSAPKGLGAQGWKG